MPSGEDLSIGRLFGVAGKVIVVTGGSKGIGLMIASGFVQNGARVYIFSRKPAMEAAAALSARGPGSCVALQCDVADRAQIDAVAAQVGAAEPGGVHCLVNNSGATWGEPFDTTPKKSWDKLNAVNVVGLFETTQAFMPLLERSIADDGAGASARVINIASIDGMRTPQIEEYAYTATKVGRQAFSGGGAAARTAAARTWSARSPSPPPRSLSFNLPASPPTLARCCCEGGGAALEPKHGGAPFVAPRERQLHLAWAVPEQNGLAGHRHVRRGADLTLDPAGPRRPGLGHRLGRAVPRRPGRRLYHWCKHRRGRRSSRKAVDKFQALPDHSLDFTERPWSVLLLLPVRVVESEAKMPGMTEWKDIIFY